MNTLTRSRLDTGQRVHAFSLAHPADDGAQQALVDRLGERLKRAETLATQEKTGHLTAGLSVDTKDEIRSLIREDLRVLSGIAALAAEDEPGVDVVFRLPAFGINHQGFLSATRAVLAQAQSRQEQFAAHGLPAAFLEHLGTLLVQYEEAVEDKREGINAHVGANADLASVGRDIILIVHLLDRLNTIRYRKEPELLAAWNSASEVIGPARAAKNGQPVGEGQESGATEPRA